jgi:hypothetical protein
MPDVAPVMTQVFPSRSSRFAHIDATAPASQLMQFF